MKDEEKLTIELNGLKSEFTLIIRELGERWDKAKQIHDLKERRKEYSDIFATQDKVMELLRSTTEAVRKARG